MRYSKKSVKIYKKSFKIRNNDKQNYPLCGLKLLVDTPFGLKTKLANKVIDSQPFDYV